MSVPPALDAYVITARAHHVPPAAIAAALRVERNDERVASPRAAAQARARARVILADPVFRHRAGGPQVAQTPVERFLDWVRARIMRVLRSIFRRAPRIGSPASTVIGSIVLIATLMLLSLVAAVLVSRIGPRRSPSLPFAAEGGDDSLVSRADDAARRGDFRTAVTYAFGAALRRLDRLGLVPFDPSRTPNEYRRAVRRARAALDEPFGVLAAAFVLAVYGERPPDAARWTSIRASLDALQ